jgi:FkbM family methyltransferase
MLDYKSFVRNVGKWRKSPEVVIDVGACVGSLSWLFHRAWPDAKIYALEPVRESYSCLKKNIGHIPHIKPLRVGASDHKGTMTMAMPTIEQKQYANPGTTDNMGIMSVYGESELCRQEIEVEKLDNMFRFADVIKIDVEGHDYQVLLGAERLLKESRPFLIVEMIPSNFVLGGNDVKDLLLLLARHNYQVVMVSAGNAYCVAVEKLSKETARIVVDFEVTDEDHYRVTWRKL